MSLWREPELVSLTSFRNHEGHKDAESGGVDGGGGAAVGSGGGGAELQ